MQLCCAMKKSRKLLTTYITHYHNSLFIFHSKKEVLEIIVNYSFETIPAIFKCYETSHLNALK